MTAELWVPTFRVERPNGRRWVAGAMFGALILSYNDVWLRSLDILHAGVGERVSRDTADWAKAHLPPEAVILTMQVSGAFFYYTDFSVVRYDDFIGEGLLRLESEAAAHGTPLYAVLFPFERERLLATLTDNRGGTWIMVGDVRDVTIWRFKTPSSI